MCWARSPVRSAEDRSAHVAHVGCPGTRSLYRPRCTPPTLCRFEVPALAMVPLRGRLVQPTDRPAVDQRSSSDGQEPWRVGSHGQVVCWRAPTRAVVMSIVFRAEDVKLDLRIPGTADFRSQVRTGDVGAVRVTEVMAPTAELSRTAKLIRRSEPGLYKIDVVAGGHMAVDQDRRQACLGPGDFTLVDLSRPGTGPTHLSGSSASCSRGRCCHCARTRWRGSLPSVSSAIRAPPRWSPRSPASCPGTWTTTERPTVLASARA
jgi:AraC-binding-like domain